jgi:voltage-gated potassium channel Kch
LPFPDVGLALPAGAGVATLPAMLLHIAYAAGLVFGTVFIHAACTVAVLTWLHTLTARHWVLRSPLTRSSVVGAVVFLMSLAAILESSLWAGFYVMVGALPTFAQASYFSLVTFTTLGYGDVTLNEQWRTLGAFQAANGILMFGWTTAIIVAVANRVFVQRRADEDDS